MYKLHAFAQSGNCYKVALLLQALKVDWETVHMPFSDFAAGVPRSDGFRQSHNAMGEVPILEVDGRKMTQSGAILLWLAEKHGAYGGRSDDEKQEVLRWILFDNHKLTSYFATYRFLRAFAASPADPAVLAFFKARVDGALAIVDKHLATAPFVVGDRLTIADLSMSSYLHYPAEESGYDLPASHPHIARWLERIRATPGWTPPYELMPGERIAPRR